MKTERLTIAEVAARLGVNRGTVATWIKGGILPAVRSGRCTMIDLAAVEMMHRSTCEGCGKAFMATRKGHRFCKPVCRWDATYQARKADHPATRGPGRPPKIAPATDPTPAALRPDVRAILDGIRAG